MIGLIKGTSRVGLVNPQVLDNEEFKRWLGQVHLS
jgi:hypothetical protein